ncbi:hypothetical protein [Trinickia dinghuensis]|uniref:hypothetical protein n=1 Tax=Trinickia dinghuensis TaxID=2291023 RepID=UPI0011C05123|nr:hypothetical protein [Trinickia dinghuensis]
MKAGCVPAFSLAHVELTVDRWDRAASSLAGMREVNFGKEEIRDSAGHTSDFLVPKSSPSSNQGRIERFSIV